MSIWSFLNGQLDETNGENTVAIQFARLQQLVTRKSQGKVTQFTINCKILEIYLRNSLDFE